MSKKPFQYHVKTVLDNTGKRRVALYVLERSSSAKYHPVLKYGDSIADRAIVWYKFRSDSCELTLDEITQALVRLRGY